MIDLKAWMLSECCTSASSLAQENMPLYKGLTLYDSNTGRLTLGLINVFPLKSLRGIITFSGI